MKPNVGHVAALLTACLLGSSAGCQSIQVGGLDMLTSPLSKSFSAIKDAATVNTDQHPDLGQGPSAGERLRLERARNLAETGRHAEAEALLVDLKGQGPARFLDFSKRSRKTFLKKLDKDRRIGDDLNPNLVDPRAAFREDTLFLLAESQFHLKKFSNADDSYTELLTDFPSTRHIDRASQRLFEIGRYWLDSQNFKAASEIRPANAIVPPGRSEPGMTGYWFTRLPLIPNMTDGTRPLFDTGGRALRTLKTIWLNDPTGHLADDALMLAAATYLERGDTREADRILTNLRKLYPDSPYLEPAFLLGSHVRLMGYQGSAYDETPLDEAAQLKRSTLGLFPDIKEKQRLQSELDSIEASRAEREWQRVEFYRKKNLPKAMAVHLNRILARFAGTVHEERARRMLLELGPDFANGRWMMSEVQAAGNPSPVIPDAADEPPPGDIVEELPPRPAPEKLDSDGPPTTSIAPSEPTPLTPSDSPASEPSWQPTPQPTRQPTRQPIPQPIPQPSTRQIPD